MQRCSQRLKHASHTAEISIPWRVLPLFWLLPKTSWKRLSNAASPSCSSRVRAAPACIKLSAGEDSNTLEVEQGNCEAIQCGAHLAATRVRQARKYLSLPDRALNRCAKVSFATCCFSEGTQWCTGRLKRDEGPHHGLARGVGCTTQPRHEKNTTRQDTCTAATQRHSMVGCPQAI